MSYIVVLSLLCGHMVTAVTVTVSVSVMMLFLYRGTILRKYSMTFAKYSMSIFQNS